MHTVQSGYSLTLEVDEDKLEALSNWLTDIGKDPANNSRIPFSKCKSTLYCSIVTVPVQQRTEKSKKLPAMLMFLSSISGPQKVHIQELVEHAGDGMREMLSFCKGVDAGKIASDKGLYNFLNRKKVSDTFYTGIQYMTYDDIDRENQLRDKLEAHIDQQQSSGNPAYTESSGNWATNLRNELVNYVASNQDTNWATKKWKKGFANAWVNNITLIRTFIFILCIGLITLAARHFEVPYLDELWHYFWKVAGIGVGLILLLLILNDFRNHYVIKGLKLEKFKEVNAHQTNPVINEVTLAGPLRVGWIRRIGFYLILKLAKLLKFALKIPTVVCARWIPMNSSQRLVFISNFSNTSEGYVRDFIDSKSRGRKINLIFGQGYGYPKTLLLVLKGAIDNPIPFVNDVYHNQHITQVWYSPFKNLTVDNIKINRQIRLGLAGNMTETEAREWLKLL